MTLKTTVYLIIILYEAKLFYFLTIFHFFFFFLFSHEDVRRVLLETVINQEIIRKK